MTIQFTVVPPPTAAPWKSETPRSFVARRPFVGIEAREERSLLFVEFLAGDEFARFDHQDVEPLLGQSRGGYRAADAGADHHDLGADHLSVDGQGRECDGSAAGRCAVAGSGARITGSASERSPGSAPSQGTAGPRAWYGSAVPRPPRATPASSTPRCMTKRRTALHRGAQDGEPGMRPGREQAVLRRCRLTHEAPRSPAGDERGEGRAEEEQRQAEVAPLAWARVVIRVPIVATRRAPRLPSTKACGTSRLTTASSVASCPSGSGTGGFTSERYAAAVCSSILLMVPFGDIRRGTCSYSPAFFAQWRA